MVVEQHADMIELSDPHSDVADLIGLAKKQDARFANHVGRYRYR